MTDSHDPGTSSANDELSITLIGNKDLKFKLLGDSNFVSQLIKTFETQVKQVVNDEAVSSSFVESLQKTALILKTLCSFVTQINTDKHKNIKHTLECLHLIISPTLDLFHYYTTSDRKELQNIVSYCIDTLLNLSNTRNYSTILDSDKLCQFVVSLLAIPEDPLLVKVLHLIPLLLSCPTLNTQYLVTLITALLNRLSTICDSIIRSHLPHCSSDTLYDLAFENDQLPNIELNHAIISSTVNIQLLTQLVVGTAQIFAYSKETKRHVFVNVEANSNRENTSTGVIIPDHVYLCLQLIFKYENELLSLGSLNLISLHLSYLKYSSKTVSDELIYHNYKKLFPHIIGMLQLQTDLEEESALPLYLSSQGGILINMCSQYPLISEKIRDTNLDIKIISRVESLYKSSSLLKELTALKKLATSEKILVDFTALLNQDNKRGNEEVNELADLLYLLSIYGSTNEDWRGRITSSPSEPTKLNLVLSQLIFELMDNYHFLLQQLALVRIFILSSQKTRRNLPADLGKNLGIIISLVDSPLYMNALHLTRSLSRSVNALRTFFVESNALKSFSTREISIIAETNGITNNTAESSSNGLVINFLQMLKIFGNFEQTAAFFQRVVKIPIQFKYQMINKSTLTGILANFILDFSSFRYSIVNCANFLESLSVLYKKADVDDSARSDESKHQMHLTQLNVMQVLKNYMFNETNANKSEIFEYFPLISILKNTFYGFERKSETDELFGFIKLQKKLVSFDILRNFTAGSPHFARDLVQTYESSWDSYRDYELPPKWFDYVAATLTSFKIFRAEDDITGGEQEPPSLISMIMNEDYVKLVTSINYIEDHKYITANKIERDGFPHDNLLSLWMDILELNPDEDVSVGSPSGSKNASDMSQDRVLFRNNLNEIKLSIIWILINLTWKASSYGFTVSQEVDYSLFETLEQRTQKLIDERVGETSEEGSGEHMTIADRAKYLKEFGFPRVLGKLIEQYSEQRVGMIPGLRGVKKESGKKADGILKRFDIQNSYDLLEKLKTAHNQISGILRSGRRPSMSNRSRERAASGVLGSSVERSSFLASLGDGPGSPDSLVEGRVRVSGRPRRVYGDDEMNLAAGGTPGESQVRSTITNARYPGDVNRGGEGFGYDSVDELEEDQEMEEDAHTRSSAGRPEAEEYDEHDEFWVA